MPEFRFTPPRHREHAMTQEVGPFANLDESALRALAPHGAVRSFSKNAVVVSEGDETDSLYILLSGRVKAFVSEEDGREVVLSTVGVGDYFGEHHLPAVLLAHEQIGRAHV